MREAEKSLRSWGVIAASQNVNTGTSGAEIEGAFGGEKETRGGRECAARRNDQFFN